MDEILDVKEVKSGKFRPKRTFLNFVASMGNRTRVISNFAFIKGEKLSGMLDGARFKFTIYEDGTIDVEEEDTSLADDNMIKRLIDDIDQIEATGYVHKFVVRDLEFESENGERCYLEVKHKKPFDRLKSLFDDKEPIEVSDKASSFLDSLFADSDNEATDEEQTEVIDNEAVEVIEAKVETIKEETFMEETFRKMNEAKVNELVNRIQETEANLNKYKRDLAQAERSIDSESSRLSVLQTRLDTFNIKEESIGYVFQVSDANQSERILTDVEQALVSDIAKILKADERKLTNLLSNSMFVIKLSNKDDFEDKKLTRDVLDRLKTIDLTGSFNINQDGNIEYVGKLTWHQVVDKLINKGFEQNPEFEKFAGSNSYQVEDKEEEINLGGIVLKSPGGFADMGNGVIGVLPSDEDDEDDDEEIVTEFTQRVIRTFTEPTDLVIIGSENGDRDIELTDDYSVFSLRVNGVDIEEHLECDGFITILTIPEYKAWYKNRVDESGEDLEDGTDSVFIQGYKGTIGIGLYSKEMGYVTDFDESSYIYHQERFKDYPDFFMNLEEGANYKVLEGHDLSKVLSYTRDIKISEVLK